MINYLHITLFELHLIIYISHICFILKIHIFYNFLKYETGKKNG